MANVIWTEPALNELDEIADYISLDNPDAAKRLVSKIFNRIDVLEQHPESGKPVKELTPSVYREIVLSPCRVFYRLEKDLVYIIHVIREQQYLHTDMLIWR